MVMMPPRHGKSELVSKWFPAWYLGLFPDNRIILSSYEAQFAASWGRRARDILEEYGQSRFGISIRQDSHAADWWEIEDHEGGMFTAGVGGPLSGKGAECAIIDDPVKNAEEAASPTMREKIWEWYLSTLETRLHKNGSIILIQTRWHEDDLAGRLLKIQGDRWEVLSLPAIAEQDENYGDWKRAKGAPLCPELIPMSQLQEYKANDFWWASLYQQRPFPRGGGIFRRVDFDIVQAAPHPNMCVRVRAWDLAASVKQTAKRTAGLLLSKDPEGIYYVESVVKGKWVPGERDQVILQTAKTDGRNIPVIIEQEGGSGGIAQIDTLVKSMAGWRVQGIQVTGDKLTRADPVASQSNRRSVKLVRGDWNDDFLSEAESFPNGEYLDQIDALSLAFSFLCDKKLKALQKTPAFKADWRDEMKSPMERRDDWRKEFA